MTRCNNNARVRKHRSHSERHVAERNLLPSPDSKTSVCCFRSGPVPSLVQPNMHARVIICVIICVIIRVIICVIACVIVCVIVCVIIRVIVCVIVCVTVCVTVCVIVCVIICVIITPHETGCT